MSALKETPLPTNNVSNTPVETVYDYRYDKNISVDEYYKQHQAALKERVYGLPKKPRVMDEKTRKLMDEMTQHLT